MGLPPSLELLSHLTDMEVEDVGSTDTMVGAEGANVCVCGIVDKVLSTWNEPEWLRKVYSLYTGRSIGRPRKFHTYIAKGR